MENIFDLQKIKLFRFTSIFLGMILLGCNGSSTQPIHEGHKLVIQPIRYEFGTVVQGKRIKKNVTILNSGTEPVELIDSETECSCTVLKLKNKTLEPGEEIEVKVVLDTDHLEGKVHKNVTLITDVPDEEYIISLVGKVLPKR